MKLNYSSHSNIAKLTKLVNQSKHENFKNNSPTIAKNAVRCFL